MHEVAVVSNIVDAVLCKLEEYPDAKVVRVNLIIGDMTSLGTEQLEFAYSIVTKGTRLENVPVSIENEKVTISCETCGYEGEAEGFESDIGHNVPILACPKCNGSVKILTGEACGVKDIEIEET